VGGTFQSGPLDSGARSLKRSRGLTVPEVIIASGLLFMLSALCLSIYVSGVRAWTKIDSKTEVMGVLQAVQDRIATEVRSSQLPSVAAVPDKSGVAFLWAGTEGSRQVDGGGRIVWQDFVFFYTLPLDDKLYRKTVPYAVADQTILTTLEVYSTNPLAMHKIDGQVVARSLTKFEAVVESPDLLRVLLRAKVEKSEMELESCYRLTHQP
jgi:hypothetical protein